MNISTNPLARETMTFVLAGGRAGRLKELTDIHAKPAVYFGGKSRIIDFALSNAVNTCHVTRNDTASNGCSDLVDYPEVSGACHTSLATEFTAFNARGMRLNKLGMLQSSPHFLQKIGRRWNFIRGRNGGQTRI